MPPSSSSSPSSPQLPTASLLVQTLLLLLSLSSSPSAVAQAAAPQKASHVIHIVADGLRSDYLTAGHPAFDYLLQTGSCTLNARHDDLSSQTLPNHISMFTGLPISEHGYREDKDYGGNTTLVDTTNNHRPFTSIFDLVDSSRSSGITNGRTGIFTSKAKFQLFDRSFPVSSYYENKKSKAVVRRFLNELSNKQFAYSYLHIVDPDLNGHRYDGAASPQYAQGVALASYRLGEVLDLLASDDALRATTAIILTADHGFSAHGNHADQDDIDVYTIPFCVWGPGVQPHGELYEMNKDNGSGLVDPGDDKARGRRVVRNTYAGVLAADLLGIAADEEGGPFADRYMAVNGGTADNAETEAAMTWTEWKAAKADEYDWSEPSDEEEEMEGEVVDSVDEEGNSNDTTVNGPAVSVPVEEVSKQEDQEDVPVPMDVDEVAINTEDIPVPIDVEKTINTENVPVPIEVEVEEEQEEEKEEEEVQETSTVLVTPTQPTEDVSKANSMPVDNEPVDTTRPNDESADTLAQEEQEEALWDSTSESQDQEDDGGVGPDISAFITETTYSNTSNQTSGLNGIEIGLIAASAVALLALGIAVYIYATTSKAKAQHVPGELHQDELEKAAKLDETRISVSSGGSDDGTDNLFSGYASSSTFDEESCIDVAAGRRASSSRDRSFHRSSSAVSNRSYSLNEAADAHARAVEAGAWPDDVVPLESVEVEAVEVTVTETKTIWHVVDLQR